MILIDFLNPTYKLSIIGTAQISCFASPIKRKVIKMTTSKKPNEVRQGQTDGHLRYVLMGGIVLAVIAAFVLMSAYQ